MKSPFTKRISFTAITLCVMLVSQFGALFAPGTAHAQFGGIVSDPGNYAQRAAFFAATQAQETKDEVESSFSRALTAGVLGILVNGVSFLARKLAYDTASYLASSAAGEESLVFKDGVGEYFSNAGLDTVGELVGSFGDTIGINLCTIPNPRINAFLQLGFENALAPTSAPKPRCTGQQLRNSWGRINEVLYERYGAGTEGFIGETFNASLSVGQSDFGIALEGLGRIKALEEVNKEAAKLERQIGQGFKDAKAAISETIYTPSANIRREAEQLTANDQSGAAQAQVAGLYAAADLYEVIPAAAGVFINTFASQLLEKSLQGLFKADNQAGGSAGIGEFFASNLQNNRRKAQEALSFLLAPSLEQINSYNLVGEFAACPETPGLNNCVIESTLLQAITVAKQGEPVTIREALDQGYLHANWPLISPRRTTDNSSANYDCYLNKYCYSNLQKLRRARILPIGFELAALKSDVDEPWTLGEVVDGFEDCNQFGESDSAHPFCHLIDPNWVIKAPETSCDTRVFGPQLIGRDTNLRRKECVDIKTCVYRDVDGTCIDWGYCTREQKVWKLGGSACEAEYATCRTYTDTTNRSQVSYLSRTVDFGQCDEDSVGCRAYSTEQVNGSWVTPPQVNLAQKQAGRPGVVTFNRNVRTCSESGEGCHGFYLSVRDQATGNFLIDQNTGSYIKDDTRVTYLKKAPEYLGCYDVNPNTLALEQAQTRTEAAQLNARTQCGNFALSCAPSEVGCELFTSRDGETLPAIVDPTQVCAPECAGYETFKEEAGNFNGETFPLYFVPSMATQCSEQYVGCEEFTNLEDTASGGEQLEYYSDLKYCEKPDGTNEREFFSWEGSDTEGYVLRVHRMLQVSQTYRGQLQQLGLPANVLAMFPVGSPVYADDTFDTLVANAAVCDQQSYNLLLQNPFAPGAANVDCRALYDDQGNVHYRLISQTVSVSEQCTRLRKTTPELFVDQALTQAGQAACQATLPNGAQRGVWQSLTQGGPPVCQRCYNGGGYQNGSCIYQTIPSEASSCRAPSDNPGAFVGCRAYTGNAGNNVNTRVIVESFEPVDNSPQALSQVLTNWSVTGPRTQPGIRVAAEAVQVGQRSLEVDAQIASRNIPVDTNTNRSLQSGAWYELSFWSRGTPQNLSIAMYQGGNITATFTVDRVTFNPVNVTIGDGWQEYRLGPVQFLGDGAAPVELRFTRSQIAGTPLGPYYIDQFRLSQLEDREFLIKNSWQRTVNGQVQNAPASCFAANQDPGGSLPGVALGCREYQDSQTNTYFLTQFGSLCREEAVGCQPVYDSHNTVGVQEAQIFDAWCSANQAVNGTCTITVSGQDLGSCPVAQGDAGCYVDAITLPASITVASFPAVHVVTSTIIVPAETNTPLYLTNRPEFFCREDQLGCMRVGLQSQAVPGNNAAAFTYEDRFVRNDPALYDDQLCEHGQVGCSEFLDGAATVYFKDPAVTGGSVCEYKTQVRVQGSASAQDGWFKRDVGVCSNNPLTECRSDSQCGGGSATCQKDISVPCYPGYLDVSGEYGIWSNQAANYNGYVGSCPAEANACVELRDKFSTSTDQLGKAYYRILDDNLTEGAGECDGQVSLTEGCVLFDLTSRPNKLYDTAATYNASSNATPQYRLVDPVSTARNDANLILKVERDRECAEWLYCANSIPQTDDAGNRIQLCSRYQACSESDGNSCLQPVAPDPNGSYLDEQTYTGRDTSWFGLDYSGYSLLNRYQIPSYVYVSVQDAPASQYLAYEQDRTLFADPQFAALGCQPPQNATPAQENTDGQVCGAQGQGRCLQRRCIYPVDGTEFPPLPTGQSVAPISDILDTITAPSCKGYPEETSPFPQTVMQGPLPVQPAVRSGYPGQRAVFTGVNANAENNYKPGFQDVNVCQTGNPEDCQCSYRKIVYSAVATDYWPVETNPELIPDGVCINGEYEGLACQDDVDCTLNPGTPDAVPGFCQRRVRQETHIGLDGFCLEYDYSRPIYGAADRTRGDTQDYACLTWLPIQTSASGNDLYNRYLEAGYYPVENYDGIAGTPVGQVMCASTERGTVLDTTYLDTVTSTASFVQSLNTTYSDAALDQILHSDMLHFDCRENSDCGGGCVFAGFFTGVWAAVSNAIAGFFVGGPVGFVAGLGSGTAITIINASNNVQGSAYTLAMCSQYEQSISGIPQNQNYPIVTPVSSYQTQAGYHQGLRSQIYQVLQAYGLHRLGSNAVVLRAETDLVGMQSSSTTQPVGFAPWRLQSTDNSDQHQVNPDRGRGNDAFNDEYERFTHDLAMDNTREPGTYSFAGAANVVNEYNLEDVYFFPLAYKGTLRGILPVTINDIYNPNNSSRREDFDNLALRLDVGGLRRGLLGQSGAMPNGYFESKAGIVIPPHSEYNNGGNNNSANIPGQWRVINFSARYASRSINGRGSGNGNNGDEFQAIVPVENKHLLTWNYVVERDPNNPTGSDFFYEDNTMERNTERKYVHVFFASPVTRGYKNRKDGFTLRSAAPTFIPSETNLTSLQQEEAPFDLSPNPPNENAEDPFVTDCQTGFQGGNSSNPRYNAWLAVALNFDANGQFLGYTTKWCDGLDSSISDDTERGRYSGGINFGVIATLSNQCADYRQVYDDSVNPISTATNKAWTNRVWSGASDPKGTASSLSARSHSVAPYSQAIDRDTGPGIYGSVPLAARTFTASNAEEQLKSFSFFDPSTDGIPYYCRLQLTPAQMTTFVPSGRSQCAFMWVNYSAEPVENGPFYQTSNTSLRQTIQSVSASGLASTAIDQLFAMQFGQALLQANRNSYNITQTPTDVSASVTSGRSDEALVAPRIYSLDPSRCFSGQSAVCTPGEPDNFTVNQRNGTVKDYNEDGFPDEDANGDAIPDPIIGVGSVVTNLNFYAIADDNRMPIKRVVIDWGNDRSSADGYGAIDRFRGLYKNRKPFCDSADQVSQVETGLCLDGNNQPTNLTCEQDRDCPIELRGSTATPNRVCASPDTLMNSPTYRDTLHSVPKFGNSQRACESRYFEYLGVYSCSLQDVNSANPPAYVRNINNLTFNGVDFGARVREVLGANPNNIQNVCVFRPRVQILDNWGYCNGRVSQVSRTYRGYYNPFPAPGQTASSCDYGNGGPGTGNPNAWTEYAGAIIVLPN